jgi:hypothetical protein
LAGGGTLLETAGAAKIAVVVAKGGFAAGGGTGFCGGSGVAGAGGITLKMFWHFPQRMLRPCGPIRASSTR